MSEPQPVEPIRVGIRELRGKLSALLRQAGEGATVLVMSRNQVIAQIQPPPKSERPPRSQGRLAGRIRMADDFDDFPEDLLAAMVGDLD